MIEWDDTSIVTLVSTTGHAKKQLGQEVLEVSSLGWLDLLNGPGGSTSLGTASFTCKKTKMLTVTACGQYYNRVTIVVMIVIQKS